LKNLALVKLTVEHMLEPGTLFLEWFSVFCLAVLDKWLIQKAGKWQNTDIF